MLTKVISLVVLLAFINMIGCTRAVKVNKEKLTSHTEKIVEVVLPTGEVIKFDHNGGRFIPEKRVIAGFTESGSHVEVNVDDILYARVSRSNALGTIVTIVGVLVLALAVVFAIALATKESCPFVYSYDGEKFVFDAEPYGGAICQGLKKTDYSRLEHLKSVGGEYRLLLKNEVEETQYTDEMSLLIVDHSTNSSIMPDQNGNMYVIEKPISPLSTLDEKGRDLTKFIAHSDNIAWQSSLPTDTFYRGRNLRHQLTFKFPKPPKVSKGYLLINIGTGLWGSNMIKEMLELRGDKVDAWYGGVNRQGLELKELYDFIEREELYVLKLYLKQGEEWVQQGVIPGGGPFINEDRVISLNLSEVDSETLEVRLNPPMGFWAIDYVGIEYESHPSPEVKKVSVKSAKDQDGKDVSELLLTTDNRYQIMPEVGNWVKVIFDLPSPQNGTKRSIFLKTSGYYEIHLSKNKPEQKELIQKLLTTPGMIVEFAMDRYLEWRSKQLSSN